MSTATQSFASISRHADFDWQAGFLAVLPSIRTHAQIRFRRLPPEQREDAVQEAIASACASYHGLAARGRHHIAHAGTRASFAVKHVRSGRHMGGSQDAAQDAMSPVAQSRYRFSTGSWYEQEVGGWRQMVVADRRTPIPDLAAFRIDFARWLRTLTCRDRKVIAALVAGDSTSAVGGRFGISAARVSQLRRRYERAWQVFHGEPGLAG